VRHFIFTVTILVSSCCLALPTFSQTSLSVGGFSSNPDEPIEMTADKLTVSQSDGSARFDGNVVIAQGNIKIMAQLVVVTYLESGGIDQLSASGGVTVVTQTESAEAKFADYDLSSHSLALSGDVLLTQGQSMISSDTMNINLTTGAAVIEGRVRTVLSSETK
jgi:lipopolysaccharide export system protein LptA